MGKKFSEQGTQSSTPSHPRKREPAVFFVASDSSYLKDALSECSDIPDKYKAFRSVQEMMDSLTTAKQRIDLGFVVVVEQSCEHVDVPALRQCKLEFPQMNFVLMLGECDQTSQLRFHSLGAQNTIMAPFNDVSLTSEIDTALPNIPQFKRHPDLMKRGMVRLDFLIPSDLSFVLGINYMISLLLKEFSFPPTDCRINVPLACDEALTNAIIHGNRNDADKKVSVHIYVSSSRFKMRVKDQGAGFDLAKVADPREGENVLRSSGRGVYLMRSIMDTVNYKEGGRVVELEKANVSPNHSPQDNKKT